MALQCPYFGEPTASMETYNTCKTCGKLRASDIDSGQHEDAVYCSCPSAGEDDQRCEKCGQRLENSLNQPTMKKSSGAEGSSLPRWCENCKVVTTVNSGKMKVKCPQCARKVPANELEKHEEVCTNYLLQKATGTTRDLIAALTEFIKKQFEDNRNECMAAITCQSETIKTLETRDKSKTDQIDQLTKTCAVLSEQNRAFQARISRLEQSLPGPSNSGATSEFGKDDYTSASNGKNNIREQMAALPVGKSRSSFSGRFANDTLRNTNHYDSLPYLGVNSVTDNQADDGCGIQPSMINRNAAPENAHRAQPAVDSANRHPPPAPPAPPQVANQQPWGSGPSCMTNSIYLNAPNATFHMGSNNNNFQLINHENAQVGCGRGHVAAPVQESNRSLDRGIAGAGRGNPFLNRPTADIVPGSGRPMNDRTIDTNRSAGEPADLSRHVRPPETNS